MVQRDTLDKIITRYFAAVTNQEFEYKGVTYTPKPLKISPGLLRGYTCPPGCGGCCPRFSLDYLPNEPHPYPLQPRTVQFDGKEITIYSDMQVDHNNHFCRNLIRENGRCGIYQVRPFSCDFELIRPLIYQGPTNVITQKLFGRGWNMTRVDGQKGALCEMTEVTDDTIREVIRKIKRLDDWCQHFGLVDNKCQDIIDWAESVRVVKRKSIPPLI